MKPQKNKPNLQMDLFKVELKRLIDSVHPLIKLAHQMDWTAFDNHFAPYFSDEGRPAMRLVNGQFTLSEIHPQFKRRRNRRPMGGESVLAAFQRTTIFRIQTSDRFFEHDTMAAAHW